VVGRFEDWLGGDTGFGSVNSVLVMLSALGWGGVSVMNFFEGDGRKSSDLFIGRLKFGNSWS
jgi:hypothetical protein